MTAIVISAQKRTLKGRGASRRLRDAGKIPAVVYGIDEAQALTLEHDQFLNAINDEAVFTCVIDLDIEGKKMPVLIKDLQRHLYANKIEHVDFQRVSADQVIEKRVPLRTVGEAKSPGVRLGALLTLLMADIMVRCKTKDLPQKIEVDCSTLQASSSIKMSELSIPEGVQLVPLLKGGREYDHAVVMVGKTR